MFNTALREIRQLLDSTPGELELSADNQRCFDAVEELAISLLEVDATHYYP